MMNEKIAALALNAAKGLNQADLKQFLSRIGSLSHVAGAQFDELVHMGCDLKAAGILSSLDLKAAEREVVAAEKEGISIVPLFSEAYPAALREIGDPPLCLYVLGQLASLAKLSIAIVGARKATRQGEDMALKLGRELAEHDFPVISGLAYGIDIAAHRGALDAKGETVAVLGSGLLKIYPANHKRYIETICEKGCVISEFPPSEAPLTYNFPKRNRVISGLSAGVVIIEASFRSGSLITCRLALEQGRDVFAVPTSPLSPNTMTNTLIKNGAHMVESWLDIAEQYAHLKPLETGEAKKKKLPEDEKTRVVYKELERGEAGIDSIIAATGLDYNAVTTSLALLELSGYIEQSNGRYRILL